MNWVKVTARVKAEEAEFVADELVKAGSGGVEFIDPSDLFWRRAPLQWDEIELDDDGYRAPEDGRVGVVGYLSEERDVKHIVDGLRSTFQAALDDGWSITLEDVSDEDWAESWKKHYRPDKIGDRVVVVPAWESYSPGEGEVVVTLDPGMAFGTGGHPTTRLCVRLLETYIRDGYKVLDVGTGSGILSITAALLGASTVTAVDIDPTAVRIARENIAANGLSDVISVGESDLITSVEGRYDLIIANIIADAIIKLLPQVARVMAPQATVLISGIVRQREAECIEAAVASGFRVVEIRRSEEWVAAATVRKG